MNQRLLYPDICKFIAIFIVTWSHCAQCISNETYTNLWGGTELDIAFNMPLFRIISGWFINLDKYRKTNILTFIISKFKRLLVPSIIWFVIYAILFGVIPDLTLAGCYWYIKGMVNYYWYLNALFVCLCIIFLSAHFLKNDTMCILVSTIGVLLCPLSEISNINFMFPFIWTGYLLRIILNSNYKNYFIMICTVMGVALCPFWNASYTVYESPFQPLQLSISMCISYVYRFVIGFSISSVIISLIIHYEKSNLKRLAVWGKDTLAIYTVSILILCFISKILSIAKLSTNHMGVLDLLSFFLCLFIVASIIAFCRLCRRHKWSQSILLGEFSVKQY